MLFGQGATPHRSLRTTLANRPCLHSKKRYEPNSERGPWRISDLVKAYQPFGHRPETGQHSSLNTFGRDPLDYSHYWCHLPSLAIRVQGYRLSAGRSMTVVNI